MMYSPQYIHMIHRVRMMSPTVIERREAKVALCR